jgi:hypothetical protein
MALAAAQWRKGAKPLLFYFRTRKQRGGPANEGESGDDLTHNSKAF